MTVIVFDHTSRNSACLRLSAHRRTRILETKRNQKNNRLAANAARPRDRPTISARLRPNGLMAISWEP
jgi:hypothetical protein